MNLLLFLKNILQLILAPTHAWKDIQQEELPTETIIQRGLYPLMAIMLITVFIRPAYGLEKFELIPLLQTALVQFVALFVALYGARAIMDHNLPLYNTTGENDPIATGTVAAYGTGLMTIIQIIENLIPIELTVVQILPAFAAVCIWKAYDYLDIEPADRTRYMLITVAALVLPVITINVVMSLIIT